MNNSVRDPKNLGGGKNGTKNPFPLGRIEITANALETLNREDVCDAIGRHGQGDWGECCPDDAAENDLSISPWSERRGKEQLELLCFHKFVAIPIDVFRAGYTKAGYDWEIEHWGCKWGACKARIERQLGGLVCYQFETPWNPPFAFLENVSHQFFQLVFELKYFEGFEHFSGLVIARNGEIEDLRSA